MRSNTLARYMIFNFLQLLLIFIVVMIFYFFFTSVIQLAAYNVISTFSFKTSLSSEDFQLLIGLQNIEIFYYFVLLFILFSLTAIYSSRILHKPFAISLQMLEQFFNKNQSDRFILNFFFKNTSVIYVTSLFENYLNNGTDVVDKIRNFKQGHFYDNIFLVIFFNITLIPLVIIFAGFILHLTYTYNSNLISLASNIDTNVVIASNLQILSKLLYVVSFLAILFFIFFLYFFTKRLRRNFSGASYSYMNTILSYTIGELSRSFYFRDYDPSLPLVSRLNKLEKKIKQRLIERNPDLKDGVEF
jgi:hypothetical protein